MMTYTNTLTEKKMEKFIYVRLQHAKEIDGYVQHDLIKSSDHIDSSKENITYNFYTGEKSHYQRGPHNKDLFDSTMEAINKRKIEPVRKNTSEHLVGIISPCISNHSIPVSDWISATKTFLDDMCKHLNIDPYYMALHLDEQSPHMHFATSNINKDTRTSVFRTLNYKSAKYNMHDLHQSLENAFSPFGYKSKFLTNQKSKRQNKTNNLSSKKQYMDEIKTNRDLSAMFLDQLFLVAYDMPSLYALEKRKQKIQALEVEAFTEYHKNILLDVTQRAIDLEKDHQKTIENLNKKINDLTDENEDLNNELEATKKELQEAIHEIDLKSKGIHGPPML